MVKHRHSWGQFSDQSEVDVSAKRRKLSDTRGMEFRLRSVEGLPEEVPFTLRLKKGREPARAGWRERCSRQRSGLQTCGPKVSIVFLFGERRGQ